jgi:hypothetical protein
VEELEALEKVVEEETPKNVRVSQYFRTVAAQEIREMTPTLLFSSLLMVQVEEYLE